MGINRVQGVPFAQISNKALRDKRLSFRARGILAMVLSNSGEWEAPRDWLVDQSDREGREAVQTALNELTELGYRVVRKVRDARGQIHTEVEWFHVPAAEDSDRQSNRPPDNPSAGEPVPLTEDDLPNTISEDYSQNKNISSNEFDGNRNIYPEDFETFWHHYPRKQGKRDAHKAWQKATRRHPAAAITRAAATLAADPNLPETRYIPHPATWLNRDGWLDEPCPPNIDQRAGPITAYAQAAKAMSDKENDTQLGIGT